MWVTMHELKWEQTNWLTMSLAFTEAPWSQSSWMLEEQSVIALRNKGTITNGSICWHVVHSQIQVRQPKSLTSQATNPAGLTLSLARQTSTLYLKMDQRGSLHGVKFFICFANNIILHTNEREKKTMDDKLKYHTSTKSGKRKRNWN